MIRNLLCILFILFFSDAQISGAETIDIKVDATKKMGKLDPFWAGIIFHPTEYLSTEWGRDFVTQLGETGAARTFIRHYTNYRYFWMKRVSKQAGQKVWTRSQ